MISSLIYELFRTVLFKFQQNRRSYLFVIDFQFNYTDSECSLHVSLKSVETSFMIQHRSVEKHVDKCSVYLNGHEIRFHNDNIPIFSILADFASVLYQERHTHISHYGSEMPVSPVVLLTIVSKLYYQLYTNLELCIFLVN